MTYMPETLTTRYIIKKPRTEISIEINDAIHHSTDVFLRKIKIANYSDSSHEVLLFFTQDFHIYGYEAGDTALFEPKLNSVIHYKQKRWFLVGGARGGKGFHEYAVGYKESEGREGTWRDAEDGHLSKNPVAQGAVDSVVSFKLDISPQNYGMAHYWIACGTSLNEVLAIDSTVKQIGVEQMLLEVENY